MNTLKDSFANLLSAMRVSNTDVGNNDSAKHEEIMAMIPLLGTNNEMLQWFDLMPDKGLEFGPGFGDLRLYSIWDLIEAQCGYRWLMSDVPSLIEDVAELDYLVQRGWDKNWIVIGDKSADPVIADITKDEVEIFVAQHGAGLWAPMLVAPSFDSYLRTLEIWLRMFCEEYGCDVDDYDEFYEDLLGRLDGVLPEECLENWSEYFGI